MQKKTITQFALSLPIALLITACATPGGGQASSASYDSLTPVCVGQMDCSKKMAVAKSWISTNTSLGLFEDSSERLETHGWGIAALTALRVQRIPNSSANYRIELEINCGEDADRFATLDCPGAAAALADFNSTVSAAQ